MARASDVVVLSACAATARRLADSTPVARSSGHARAEAVFINSCGQRPASPCVNRRRPEIALPRP
jgi:hypothetical protein